MPITGTTTSTKQDTYHGGKPGDCGPCEGTGNAYAGRDGGESGSCHHCSGSGDHTPYPYS